MTKDDKDIDMYVPSEFVDVSIPFWNDESGKKFNEYEEVGIINYRRTKIPRAVSSLFDEKSRT